MRGCVDVRWRGGWGGWVPSIDSHKIHRSLLESPWILERFIGAYWNLVGALCCEAVLWQVETLCSQVKIFIKPELFNYDPCVFAESVLTRVEQ